MKLDIYKLANGVAVHCKDDLQVNMLFMSKGWKLDLDKPYPSATKNGVYIWRDDDYLRGWNSTYSIDYCKDICGTIIPFTDLIIEEENKLIKLFHAAGVGDWLQEGTEFLYRGQRCKVTGDTVVYWDEVLHCFKEAFNKVNTIITILFNPELIKPLPKWTPEEQEMAKKDNLRFGWVARDDDGEDMFLCLYVSEPYFYTDIRKFEWLDDEGYIQIEESNYPSLLPGECVKLEDIANG